MRDASLAQALLDPRSVALIGASGDIAKNTARPQRFLLKHGYRGQIYPINRSRDEILGVRAYRSVAAIGAPVDHAFVMVPTQDVLAAIEDCGAAGVKVATIYTDGFADVGESGRGLQQAVLDCARRHGIRLIGPNCIGLANVHAGMMLSVVAVMEMEQIRAGPISVVSQSGSMMGALLSRGLARGYGFAKLVSVGNEADLAVGEIVDMLVDDPQTQTIVLFMESMRNAAVLAEAARRAYSAGKPVVVYKLGRSAVGEALAISHTGAMAGADDVADAFFRTYGIVRVDQLETLLEIAPLLARRRPTPKRGARVAVVTTTGGGAATVADRLGTLGLDVATPDQAFIARMRAAGVTVRPSPIIDLTLAATSAKYGAVLEGLRTWDGCDAILAVVGSSAQFQPQLAVKPIVEARRDGKPLVAFFAPDAPQALQWLSEQGIPAFRTPESCADALAALFDWHTPRNADITAHTAASPHPLLSARTGTLNELDALSVFAALGIATAPSSLTSAPAFVHQVPYPVVAKIASAAIAHKSDVGGVALGIADDAELRAVAPALIETVRRACPNALIDGVLVQSMVSGLGEAIVGYRHDPQVGPVVLVGAGGKLAEVMRDYQVGIAPVDLDEAYALIERVRSFALLRGFRNAPRGDLDALARIVVALSRLACVPGLPVAEAEINPVVVREAGAVAVDGLIVLRDSAG